MKQADLVKKLKQAGFWLERHGGNHDIYINGAVEVQVPRHREIKENLARRILKDAGIE